MKVIIQDKKLMEDGVLLPEGSRVVHFRMVAIGPDTLKETQYNCNNVVAIVNNQPSFFIISDVVDEVRTELHSLVDKFCDML